MHVYDQLAHNDPVLSRMLKWRENTVDSHIIKEVYFDKSYEIVRAVHVGDVVVDAGAHIGVFTLKASLQAGEKGKVYAFEPEPENFSYLKLNTKSLQNVEIFETALWSSEGSKTLYQVADNTGGHRLYPFSEFKSTVPVQTTRLDSVVNRRVDFFKIDVEASELEVLKGAKHILQNYSPFISMEVHNTELVKNVTFFLLEYGYKLDCSHLATAANNTYGLIYAEKK